MAPIMGLARVSTQVSGPQQSEVRQLIWRHKSGDFRDHLSPAVQWLGAVDGNEQARGIHQAAVSPMTEREVFIASNWSGGPWTCFLFRISAKAIYH